MFCFMLAFFFFFFYFYLTFKSSDTANLKKVDQFLPWELTNTITISPSLGKSWKILSMDEDILII